MFTREDLKVTKARNNTNISYILSKIVILHRAQIFFA
jgi:hypothetical protein